MATRMLDQRSGVMWPPELVAVGVRVDGDRRTAPSPVLDVSVLGHGLAPVVQRVQGRDVPALAAKLDALLARHTGRVLLRASLLVNGTVGHIDETTQRMLAAAGKDADYAIDMLLREGTLEFWMIGEPSAIHANVHWREGVLKVRYGNPGANTHLDGDEFTHFRLISAKILTARIGRPFGRLTKDLFIPSRTIVVDARRDYMETVLTLAIPSTALPAKRRGPPPPVPSAR